MVTDMPERHLKAVRGLLDHEVARHQGEDASGPYRDAIVAVQQAFAVYEPAQPGTLLDHMARLHLTEHQGYAFGRLLARVVSDAERDGTIATSIQMNDLADVLDALMTQWTWEEE